MKARGPLRARDVRPDRLTLLAFGAMVLIGGSNFVGVRISDRELAPFWGAGLRFGLACLIFWVIVATRRLPMPRGRELKGAVLFGVLNFAASYALVYWGFQEIPAGLGSVILSIVPLLTLTFVSAHRIERFTWRAPAGALLAASGIAVMFRGSMAGHTRLLSLLAVLAASACIAEAGVVIKLFRQEDPVTTNAVGMTVGAALLLGLSAGAGEPWDLPHSPEVWSVFGYLVTVGSVGLFMIVIFILKRWTASATSYAFVLLPLVASVESALLDAEPLTKSLLIGGALVLAGVYFGALSGSSMATQSLEEVAASKPE